jgi:hypothetical protein
MELFIGIIIGVAMAIGGILLILFIGSFIAAAMTVSAIEVVVLSSASEIIKGFGDGKIGKSKK